MTVFRVRLAAMLLVLGCGSAWALPLKAQSLQDAMASAYVTSPQLQAEYARQRSLDEDVARAAGGWKPQVTLNSQYGYGKDRLSYNYLQPPESIRESIHPETYNLQLTQPIYDFGKTAADVDHTKSVVQGGLAHLEGVETTILANAAQSYYDLYRDQVVLDLTEQTVSALTEELKSVRARFAKQDVTVADVTQAESRLARGIAERAAAEGAVSISRSKFIQATGLTPGLLKPPPPLPSLLLPASVDEATALALRNPTVREAEQALKAAQADVDAAAAAMKPTISAQISSQYANETSQGHFKSQYNEALLNLQVPLYMGGSDAARVREAKNIVGQRQSEIDEARKEAVDNTKHSLAQLAQARDQITVLKQEVSSADRALTAVKAELSVGTREVIDELNAEQELLDARIALAQAQHDEAVAGYAVMSYTGLLSARTMHLPVPLYDPKKYYDAEAGRWFGTGIPERDPGLPKSTATHH